MRLSHNSFPRTNFSRVPFFMTGIDPSAAEAVYQDLHFRTVGHPASGARIQRLKYVRDGRPHIAEVGDPEHRGEKFVMALFGPCVRRGDYYIVTVRRGYLNPKDAMFVHASEISDVDYFL